MSVNGFLIFFQKSEKKVVNTPIWLVDLVENFISRFLTIHNEKESNVLIQILFFKTSESRDPLCILSGRLLAISMNWSLLPFAVIP